MPCQLRGCEAHEKKHCTVKKSKTVEINRSCCDCCNQYQLASGLPRDFTTSLRVLSGQFSTTGAGSLGSGGSNSGKCGQDVETGNEKEMMGNDRKFAKRNPKGRDRHGQCHRENHNA
jgi:hypothetical protein